MRPKLEAPFKRLVMLAVMTAAVVPVLAAPAQAQLDPGNFEIRQEGRVVGEIFVPERRIHARNYEEHWVLFDGYRYPAPGVQITTEIVPTETSDPNPAAFLRRFDDREGATYVHIAAREVKLIGSKSRSFSDDGIDRKLETAFSDRDFSEEPNDVVGRKAGSRRTFPMR